jgi:hypothetical protein
MIGILKWVNHHEFKKQNMFMEKNKFNKTLFSLFTNSNNENTKLRPNSMKQNNKKTKNKTNK